VVWLQSLAWRRACLERLYVGSGQPDAASLWGSGHKEIGGAHLSCWNGVADVLNSHFSQRSLSSIVACIVVLADGAILRFTYT
jgi:hypothetical protein